MRQNILLLQVQQTHSEAYAGVDGTRVFYTVDTRGGNSGSAVLDESTGMVIGIHTHGGCGASSGSNSGTAINHPSLQQALAAPQGVCIPFAPIAIALPDGIPDLIDPLGQVIRVEVAGTDDGSPQPGTGQLHYRIDGGAWRLYTSPVLVRPGSAIEARAVRYGWEASDVVEMPAL